MVARCRDDRFLLLDGALGSLRFPRRRRNRLRHLCNPRACLRFSKVAKNFSPRVLLQPNFAAARDNFYATGFAMPCGRASGLQRRHPCRRGRPTRAPRGRNATIWLRLSRPATISGCGCRCVGQPLGLRRPRRPTKKWRAESPLQGKALPHGCLVAAALLSGAGCSL
jgi:hypothetical protein